jgi:hypothetical protein
VKFAALSRGRGREQHEAAGVPREAIDEHIGSRRNDMLCHLQRLDKIELPAQIEAAVEINGSEPVPRYL